MPPYSKMPWTQPLHNRGLGPAFSSLLDFRLRRRQNGNATPGMRSTRLNQRLGSKMPHRGHTVQDLLSRSVSYHQAAWAPPSQEQTVLHVLDDIRNGTYASRVTRLRDLIASGNREQYNVDKKRLPGVTFSGTFTLKRQVDALKEYNPLLVLDIDHLGQTELAEASSALRDDVHVLACWNSPSHEGIKGLVGVTFSEELTAADVPLRHRAAFSELLSYFRRTHSITLDQSGSDVTRLCFVSADNDLHLRHDATAFTVQSIPENLAAKHARPAPATARGTSLRTTTISHGILNRSQGKNAARDRAAIKSIIKFLEKRDRSITASYDQWVRVAFAIANTFTYNIGAECFLRLCRLDGNDHDEEGSRLLLESCYLGSRGELSLGTIWHYAQEFGYKRPL